MLITAAVALTGAVALVGIFARSQTVDGPSSSPALLAETQLRAAPDPNADVVGSLAADTPVELVAVSDDGSWLNVVPHLDHAPQGPEGWVPLISIRNAGDLTTLPKTHTAPLATPTAVETAAPASPTITATATPTPAYAGPARPDVRIERLSSQGNRLHLVLANVGTLAAPRFLQVAVDDRPAREVDTGGELGPGETAELLLPSEYVQRRASVTVTVRIPGQDAGSSPAGATASAIVEPDAPNDLELLTPTVDAEDGHLVVSIRNNSPIPLVGTATVSVREAPPSNRLVARLDAPFNIEPQASFEVDFLDVRVEDPSALQIVVSTDALTDSDVGNNSYPR